MRAYLQFMTVDFSADRRTGRVLAVARTLGAGTIGTEHLLAGLAGVDSGARAVLDDVDLTRPVVEFLLSGRGGRWTGPDGVEVVDMRVAVAGSALTPGANTALARFMQRPAPARTPENLLVALLDDEKAHAAAMLRACGAEVARVRRAARGGQLVRPADRVAPELRAARDVLIGRSRYRGNGLRDRAVAVLARNRAGRAVTPVPARARTRIDYAAAPVLWARAEADAIAGRRGGRARTDDLLVGLLAAYQVAEAYPHLVHGRVEQYDGVRDLVESGLDYRSAATGSATLALGEDAVPPSRLLRPGADWPRDTAELLRRLMQHQDNRSARLIQAFVRV
ncbi:hypothetical protein Acsp01_32210 [Actinoplanes sp. NBRC 101535]|nr:hypothetical protein Acsp01_32210 [Actinoplanes sp. NBRC 101535]